MKYAQELFFIQIILLLSFTLVGLFPSDFILLVFAIIFLIVFYLKFYIFWVLREKNSLSLYLIGLFLFLTSFFVPIVVFDFIYFDEILVRDPIFSNDLFLDYRVLIVPITINILSLYLLVNIHDPLPINNLKNLLVSYHIIALLGNLLGIYMLFTAFDRPSISDKLGQVILFVIVFLLQEIVHLLIFRNIAKGAHQETHQIELEDNEDLLYMKK